MKYGKEVEGRFCGLNTLFCTADEFIHTDVTAHITFEIQQIYISDHSNKLDLTSSILKSISNCVIVTVELTELTAPVPKHINVLLTLPWDSFQYLNPNDQIKFSKDNHVFACTKRQMVETFPEEFNDDKPI